MQEEKTRISKTEVLSKLAAFELDEKVEPFVTEQEVPRSPYIDAAAVMAFYEPEKILPLGNNQGIEEKETLICELIGCSTIISDSTVPERTSNGNKPGTLVSYKILFTLKDEVRKKTLSRLVQETRIQEALDANSMETINAKRPLQYMLTLCLTKSPLELNHLNREQLNALYKISQWLEGIEGVQTFSRSEIVGKIELLEMLSPFKHLTGTFENGIFRERFRGRHSELASLRSYVGVAPPKGMKERFQRFISSVFSSEEEKPLLVFGLGGIGKSTLISKFILEHAEAGKKDRFPFVYLDFDRPHLSALEPETLLIEAARQLSIQYRDIPELSSAFSEFYSRWNQAYGSLIEDSSSSKINVGSVEFIKTKNARRIKLQSEFLTLINKLTSKESRPFLMVLDTFEEVQFKGFEFVDEVLQFLEALGKYARMRVIISGRAPVNSKRTREMELGTLDKEAAEGYLSGIGIMDPSTAKEIVSKVGGNPLTLKLAAQLVNEYGTGELSAVSLQDSGFFFSKSLPEIEVQAILYNRILSHIRNKDVRKLAHPGMVLRKITPELIQMVLAGPCDLEIKSLAEAEILFREISKEVALVTPSEPGVLRHRSDVRKIMLKLIMDSDKKEQAMAIHRLAVAYYSPKEGIMNRSEEFYHRLALEESPRELDSRWIEGMEDYLVGSRDELPEKAQAFILGKAGLESIDVSVWEAADEEDQTRHLAKQAANLLNSGLAARALQLLEDILPTNLVLTLIKVRALVQLQKFSDAAYLSRQALNSYYADDIPVKVKTELQQYANRENISSINKPNNEGLEGFSGEDGATGSSRPYDESGPEDMTTLSL